ncbi:ABC transporter ATP-binding protein [Nocardioides carbamazepini]|uniref:ABC transporter ATP-binding protein n=1 Tax=Nocardioides carbamazepini TaxID=2854259 RepID=UPI002149D4DE|nr:ABC transporter ATP-binding protein [Nocardioides carbamazepini]
MKTTVDGDFEITGLVKKYGSNLVVDGLDITIRRGEILVLLGSSGCGKTTTLRCLAGLETPDGGVIAAPDRPLFDKAGGVDVPTHKRNIGMVFQSYALWPHMTVRKNIEYPLRVRRNKAGLAEDWALRAAEMVSCEGLLDRYPAQLSGGQQQRVALARGLVSRPDLVLFDEPLSNLDAKLRADVRSQIRELHQDLGFTGVLVTHDQEEAFALADRVAVMRNGRIEQCAAPAEIFRAPASEYVAAFIGMANRLRFVPAGGAWTSPEAQLSVPTLPATVGEVPTALLFGPGDVRLFAGDPGALPGTLAFPVAVSTVEFGGKTLSVGLRTGEVRLHARVELSPETTWMLDLQPGKQVWAGVPHHAVHAFAAEEGAVGEAA